MKKMTFGLVAALLATTATSAMADPIKYVFTGTVSGTRNGNRFDNLLATFVGYGDTSTATTGQFGIPTYVGVNLTSFTGNDVNNGQSFTITTPAMFGLYQQDGLTRLGFVFEGNGSNGIGIESAAYNGYTGLTGFGQTAGSVYYANASFSTSGGPVTIDGLANATFAAGVPEPATWALMIMGFGAVGGAMRRRAKVSTKVSFA